MDFRDQILNQNIITGLKSVNAESKLDLGEQVVNQNKLLDLRTIKDKFSQNN